jgi:hypothetical protein
VNAGQQQGESVGANAGKGGGRGPREDEEGGLSGEEKLVEAKAGGVGDGRGEGVDEGGSACGDDCFSELGGRIEEAGGDVWGVSGGGSEKLWTCAGDEAR